MTNKELIEIARQVLTWDHSHIAKTGKIPLVKEIRDSFSDSLSTLSEAKLVAEMVRAHVFSKIAESEKAQVIRATLQDFPDLSPSPRTPRELRDAIDSLAEYHNLNDLAERIVRVQSINDRFR